MSQQDLRSASWVTNERRDRIRRQARPATPERPPQLVRLLEAEPDFGAGIDEDELAEARREAMVPVVVVAAGAWDSEPHGLGEYCGLLVNGLLVRDCWLAGRRTTQLVGPGDVVPLMAGTSDLPFAACTWRAPAEARMAILDEAFMAALERWPWLAMRVIGRAALWADRSLMLQAISQLSRVDRRIVALFWHLADRWGRVRPDGILVPLELTHEALGLLVGARRPTVTLALRELREHGRLQRQAGGWLLSPGSRELIAAEVPAVAPLAPVNLVGAEAAAEMQRVRLRAADTRRAAAEQRDRARSMRAER